MRAKGKCCSCGEATSRVSKVLCRDCSQRERRCKEKPSRPNYLVDERFLDVVGHINWHYSNGYVRCSPRASSPCLLHRLVWSLACGDCPEILDHINGDRLDCRLCNLRPATPALNARNKQSSGAVEVRHGRFQARISRHGKIHSLGYFPSREEAESQYREAKEILMEFESLESLS